MLSLMGILLRLRKQTEVLEPTPLPGQLVTRTVNNASNLGPRMSLGAV